jgi:Carboxypeptidase regulatory-like domain/TonB dependent receptor-like, beta-barrel
MLKRIFFLLVLIFVTGTILFAQVTTSSISGAVTSSTGEPLVGATIIATHQPSGTRYTTISRGGGQYTITNMRVGGPYLIQISFVGFDMEKVDEVYLKLAETFIVNSSLTKTVGTLENVIVSTGRRNPILNSGRTGAVTNIGLRQIQQLPSITRSINDFTRATPQANGSSIAGGNFRQNNFTIDGADFNNSFGIGTNLPANGAPVSIDAIEEISVNITPYDIRQSGFIGSAINAVTRAGTNNFSGSVYNYFRNEKQRGDKVEKTTFIRPLEQYKLEGVRLGGPIIKNKLFFFLNYEKETQPKTVQTRFAATAAAPYGSSPQIARPTADSLNYIRQYLLNKYDYETGPFDNYSTDILRKKILARIDWNISSKHRLNVRYSQVEGGEPNPPSTSVTGSGANATPTRQDVTALWFKNSNYFQGANFYSFAAELNSTFGKFSNTLRGTYTFQNDSRETDSQVFPFVDIMSSTGVPTPAVYTSFGYEPFSFGNLRKVKMYSFVDNFSWRTNNHNWTVGLQADFSTTINGFQRFATSYYRFATWNDFVTNQKPTDFAITYSLSPNFAPAFSSFKFAQYSAYGQDEITVNKNFRLTLGLRIDQPSYPSVPQIITHPLVAALTFANGEKINTGNLPEKRLMWSPRVGFNWDLYGNRSLQIRGGTGIFTGKVPFVWIVSQSGDAGMIQVTQNFNSPSTVPPSFNPDPAAYRPATVPAAGTVIPSAVDALAHDFKFPQTWKSSIAMDTKLPWGMIATVEAIYNKDVNTAYFKNVNLVAPQPLNIAGYPDNRLIYPNPNNLKFINPLTSAGQVSPSGTSAFNTIVMHNSNKGYYFSLTAKIDKQFNKGFFASVAYTKSISANLFDGNGDQPLSAWQSTSTVNGSNSARLDYASYVVPDRLIAVISFRKEYIKHLATTISALYQGSIDGRFSYVYNGDFNRDGFSGNDLIYIPTNARDTTQIKFIATTVNGVNYSAAQQGQLFEDYINQDKYLKSHRGQYAERNGAQIPWRNQVDVKVMQDLFLNVGRKRNTFQLSIDIFNFGNLLNPSWGKVKSINASSILVTQNATGTGTVFNAGGTVTPTFKLATDRGNIITRTFRDNVSTASTYSIQFGLRYIFN